MSTILCPIDFSESSDASIDLAASIALATGRDLLLFHVDPPATFSVRTLSSAKHRELVREHEGWLESRLASARMRLHSDSAVDALSRVTRGEPAKEIAGLARESQASLVVMSTHSSAVRRAILGSVAQKVAQTAPCPVLLVRDHSYAKIPFESATVCIDFSALSYELVGCARMFCTDETDLELLHVVDEPAIAALQVSMGKREEVLSIIDKLHDDARSRLKAFGDALPDETSARQTVVGGPIAGTILSHSHDTRTGLIVVGAHTPIGIRQRILGTVADRVLHHANVPVLLCPHAAS